MSPMPVTTITALATPLSALPAALTTYCHHYPRTVAAESSSHFGSFPSECGFAAGSSILLLPSPSLTFAANHSGSFSPSLLQNSSHSGASSPVTAVTTVTTVSTDPPLSPLCVGVMASKKRPCGRGHSENNMCVCSGGGGI